MPNLSSQIVTQHLLELLARQVQDHGLVVWYDPERAYEEAFRLFEQRTTDHGPLTKGQRTIRYDGSFFRLRHEIDSLLNDSRPPGLLVYVPMDQARTDHALIELEAAGVVMQPSQQPPARNTRLSLVARNALRPLRGETEAAEIEKQVEAGKLSLADLDAIGERNGGVISLVFGTGNPQEVALAFLASDRHDAEVQKKSAVEELAGLLRATFEADLPATAPLPELRDRLARHVLMTDLVASLGSAVPSALASAKVASSTAARHACMSLARTWRLRRDVRDSYVVAARKIEQGGVLAHVEFNSATIDRVETFSSLERTLLRHVEESLLREPSQALLDLALSRQSRFWSEVTPTIQARWALIAAAAEVLLEADRVARALKDAPETVPGLVNAYAEGDHPWCLLDTHHRHLEGRWYNFESGPGDDHSGLDDLIMKARGRYTEVASELARLFVAAMRRPSIRSPACSSRSRSSSRRSGRT